MSQDFAPLRNSQRGPVLLLASGPSAAELNLDAWQDVPIITMNGAIAKLSGSGTRQRLELCRAAT